MDNLVTITNIKENDIEFNVDVQGNKNEEINVTFIIEAKDMEIGFPAKKIDDKWCVTIPPLPFLEKTGYNFHINVVVDGYLFEPLRGMVNVVGTHEVYTTTPKNVTISSTVPDNSSDETSVEQLLKHNISNEEETITNSNESSITNNTVRDIIQSISSGVKKKKPNKKKATFKEQSIKKLDSTLLNEEVLKDQEVKKIINQVTANSTSTKEKNPVKFKKIN